MVRTKMNDQEQYSYDTTKVAEILVSFRLFSRSSSRVKLNGDSPVKLIDHSTITPSYIYNSENNRLITAFGLVMTITIMESTR